MATTFTSLDQLTRIKLIAAGSFGKVYLVKDKSGVLYAMKQLNKVKIIAMKQTAHVQHEIEIIRKAKNNYIAKFYGVFQDEKYVYAIFEFVAGGELFYHLRRAEKFPVNVAKFYLSELVVAIGYCHDKMGVLYRDLKPENVLLDKKGHIRLIDFGFAKQTTELTFTLLGTPEYLAPELIRQSGHHKSADWWSFGVITYELLCGVPPFYDEDVNQIYRKILDGTVNYPPDMDSNAQDLIRRLLNLDKEKRLGANVQTGTADVKQHSFFRDVNWNWVEKRLVKPPIIPQIADDTDLDFWKDAQEEFVEDEVEIQEMVESGEAGHIPGTQAGIDAMFAWI